MASEDVRGGRRRRYWDLPVALRKPGQTVRQYLLLPPMEEKEAIRESRRVNDFLKSVNHAITTQEANAWYFGESEPADERQMQEDAAESKVPSVREWIPRWVKLKTNRVLDETLELYQAQLEIMLSVALPDPKEPNRSYSIGDLRLNEVTGEIVNDLFTEIKKTRKARNGRDPISDSTIQRYYACLQNVWTIAIEQELDEVTRNPVLKCGWTFEKTEAEDYDDGDEKADEYFEPDEYNRLLALIDPRFKLFVRFMGETGVRIGEATALQVGDLNFARNKAHIRRAWKLRAKNDKDENGKPVGRGRPGPTKGKRRRWIEVPPSLMAELRKHIIGKSHDDWVFNAPNGEHIRHSNFRNRQWLPALIKAQQCRRHLPVRIDRRNGLEVYDPHSPSTCACLGDQKWTSFTPHSLRHTYATWCILDPLVSIKLLSEQLGHKDVRTTENTYIHVRTKVAELGTAAAIERTLGTAIEGRMNERHLTAV